MLKNKFSAKLRTQNYLPCYTESQTELCTSVRATHGRIECEILYTSRKEWVTVMCSYINLQGFLQSNAKSERCVVIISNISSDPSSLRSFNLTLHSTVTRQKITNCWVPSRVYLTRVSRYTLYIKNALRNLLRE